MTGPNGEEAAELQLVSESKIGDLLGRPRDRFEASGVRLHEGSLYVVFDDTPRVLRLAQDWDAGSAEPELIETGGRAEGYEGLTFEASERRFYCLIEASETPTGAVRPGIDVFDESFRYQTSRWLDFPVKRENKGIEGIAVLSRDGADYVLGMCEGNACKSGSAGREPGQGRIQVFRGLRDDDTGTNLDHLGTIRLPGTVLFEDYAALDIRDDTVTVVSQMTSAVWIGRLRPGFDLDDPFEGEGTTYLFPRDREGRTIYCNIEGLTWLPDGSLVVVSDRAKTDEQASRCQQRDQSIHRFRLPDVVR